MPSAPATTSSGCLAARAAGTGRSRALPWLPAFALILLALILLAPLLVVDVPPLLDYPNHLARLVVLAHGDDPVLSRFYAPRWAIIPNLGIDLVMPRLLRVMPVHVAGRLMLAVTLLLPVAGVLAHHRALFRQEGHHWWPLASALLVCNAPFLLGFVNFQISLGLALLLAACWTRWRDPFPARTTLGCSAGTAALFFCHLGGLLFLAILLGAREAELLVLRLRARQPVLRPGLAGVALLAVTLLPAVLLYCASAFSTVSAGTQYLSWPEKLAGLFHPVLAYDARLDALTGLAVLGFVGACVLARRWRMPLRSRFALAATLLLYAVTPFSAKGGAWLDARFTVMAALLLFAGGTPRLPARGQTLAILAFATLLLVRTAVVAAVWSGHATDLRQLRASIADVAPGTRVLVVRISPRSDPGFWARAPLSRRIDGARPTESHDAALLLIEHRAFWPLLFAIPSQQPVTVLPPYREIAMPIGEPPDYHDLLVAHLNAAQLRAAPYLQNWQQRFDDLLVLDAEGVPDLSGLLPHDLERLNRTGFAALYRIRGRG